MATGFKAERIYEPAAAGDGRRVLVDRLWPRGVSKERAGLDAWDKELSPSTDLRKWFHEDRDTRYEEFARRYAAELAAPERQERLEQLRIEAARHTVTLLTGAAARISH